MDLIKTYHIKEGSDDWFPYYLRLHLEWDDKRYLEMMELISLIMNEYKGQLLVPKLLVTFFTFNVNQIIGIASNPNFTNFNISWIKNPEVRKKYKDLVERRIQELKKMQADFLGNYCCDYLINDANK